MSNISNKKRFAINASSGFVAQLTTVVVGFIILPYAVGRLGEQGYGIYQLVRSVIVFFTFLQLGMGPTLVRFCSRAIAQKDFEQIHKISSTAQLILGSLGLLGMTASLLLIPFFIRFYEIPPQLTLETAGLLACLAISLFLNLLFIVPQGIVFGSNRHDLANGVEIASNIIRLGLVVVTFELIRPSLFLLGLATLIAQLFRFIALFLIGAMNVGRSICFSYRKVDGETVRSMLGFSILAFLNTLAFGIATQAPVLIIGKVYGAITVTAFAPAIMIANAVSSFVSQIAKPLTPLACRDHALNEGTNLGKWSTYVSQLTVCLGLGIILPLCVFGHELMELWVGPDLALGWNFVALMAFGAILAQAQSANLNLAIGTNSIKPFAYSQLFAACVLISGMLIGTTIFHWYLLGITVFIVICRVIRNVGYLSFVGSRMFSYNYLKYLIDVYVRPTFAFLIIMTVGYGLKYLNEITNIVLLGMEITVLLVLYAAISWFYVLEIETKAAIKGLIARKDIPIQA